jgi:hypothetical protein
MSMSDIHVDQPVAPLAACTRCDRCNAITPTKATFRPQRGVVLMVQYRGRVLLNSFSTRQLANSARAIKSE